MKTIMSEEYQSREERRKQQNAAKNKHKGNKKPRAHYLNESYLF